MQTGVVGMMDCICKEDLSCPIQDSADVDVIQVLL